MGANFSEDHATSLFYVHKQTALCQKDCHLSTELQNFSFQHNATGMNVLVRILQIKEQIFERNTHHFFEMRRNRQIQWRISATQLLLGQGEQQPGYMFQLNPLKTKLRPLYLKPQSVPRCKHFTSGL